MSQGAMRSLSTYEIIMKAVFPDPSQNEIPLMAHIPYQFYMQLCEIFLLTENISKYWIQEDIFELSYIFHTFENMKFPTFSWLFDPFPNPSWLCQPIPHLCKALNNLNLILNFFKIFPTHGNPVKDGGGEQLLSWWVVHHAGDPGSNPGGGLDSGHTNAWMRGEEITSCKSHIGSVSLPDWCITTFFNKT